MTCSWRWFIHSETAISRKRNGSKTLWGFKVHYREYGAMVDHRRLIQIQYTQSLTGPRNLRAHAALNNMPLPGTPHPKRVIQPLTAVILTRAKISAVKQPNTPPATSPWK